MQIRCIVAGGRDFSDYLLLTRKLDRIFSEALNRGDEIAIVCGLAKGADDLGKLYAEARDWEVLKFPADWDKHSKAAAPVRNAEMAAISTHAVIFWDGKSRGSKGMIDLCIKKKIPHRVIRY